MEPLRKAPGSSAQGKIGVGSSPAEETRLPRNKHDEAGLVGFVNIGNSCYMNATLQALSNCPPFCQYFVGTFQPSPSSSVSVPSQSAAAVLSSLLKKVWSSDRHPGHLSPRSISSVMTNRTFKGSQQQDAQEFLRCLLTQIHDEMCIQVPPSLEQGTRGRESMMSCDSDVSAESLCSQSRLVGSARNSPLIKKRSNSSTSLSRLKLPGSTHNSPASQSKFSRYSKIIMSSSAKSSVESIPMVTGIQGAGSRGSLEQQEEGVKWEEGDVFHADVIDGTVKVHRKYIRYPRLQGSPTSRSHDHVSANRITCVDDSRSHDHVSANRITCVDDSLPSESSLSSTESVLEEGPCNNEEAGPDPGSPAPSAQPGKGEGHEEDGGEKEPANSNINAPPPATSTTLRNKPGHHYYPHTTSIVSEVFEGILESRVRCLKCKKISETREPFQDLSLPIPGRKEIAKFNSKQEGGEGVENGEREEREVGPISRGFCTMWNYVSTLTRDLFIGPPTDLDNCLDAFFDTSCLKGENRYYCTHCRSFQDSLKEMSIVELPEVLCIHLKRFRYDAYISTNKISRHIRFPLTGLSMGPFLKHSGTAGGSQGNAGGSHVYNLDAVITHYGGAGAGHYVAFAKNTLRNSWYEFNDTRVYPVSSDTVLNAEGYVLFYRRAVSSDSHLVDITSLLPHPGTTLPSLEVCYISRHWLHLLRHLTHPGAIFQYDFACRHGAVLPTMSLEEARSLAMCIRREVWEELQREHGGGPLVQRLEICKDCKELLSQLNKRRKAETEEVQEVHAKEKRGTEDKKREIFLIFLPWVQQWQKFIHCTTLEWRPPVAIDNTPLLQYNGTEGKRTLTLSKGAPYRKVSQEVWELFQHSYGGGPVVVTNLEPFSKSTTS